MEKYPQKIVYLKKENGGLSDARNYGIPYAKGEYIAFLDSDDYVEKDIYKEMYELAKKENSDMVECDFLWKYPNKVREDIGQVYKGKKEMLEKVKSNQSLFNRAEDGAEKLIQNYIEQVGKISGKKYEVKFVYGE